MALRLITAPTVEPISLSEAKAHLRVDHADDDALITSLIKAVRQHIDGRDGWLGRALVTQTWELVLDRFPCHEIEIPIPPLQSVTSITYDDQAGVETVLSAANYTVDIASEPGRIAPNDTNPWPATYSAINAISAVRIRFVAGYAPTADSPPDLLANVPEPIKVAMKLMLGTLYENRETVVIGQTPVMLPWAAEALLGPYRVWSH